MRNRASLTPAQRAKYRAMWEEMNPPGSPAEERAPEDEIPYRNRATRPAPMEPSDLDPVEAAAAPITPDPVVTPKRPAMPKPSLTDTMESANTLASLDNFDAAFQSNGNHYPTAVAAFAQQLVARGVDPAYAQRAARARAEEHRRPSSQGVYAETMGATENPDELYAGYRNAPGGPAAALPFGALPDADPRTTRAERLAQSERWAADVDRRAAEYNRDTGMPQPSGLAGNDGYRDWGGWQPGDAVPERPRMGPTALESARESQAADRNDAIGQKYGPIAQRIAEAGDAAGVTDYAAVQSPHERQMNTYRRAIEQEARFGADTESRDRARETLATLEKSRALENIAFRDKVANAPGAQARRDKEQSRLERWQAISMLAGGSPSRQQAAMGNAFLNMPSDWQNAVSAKALRPDMDGTTPLTVDANSAKNAMRMMNAEMFAGGMPGMMQEREAARKQKQRADAFAWAQAERNRLHWNDSAPMTMQDANRLRRRVAALFGPEYADVVDALGVEDGAAPRTPPNPTGGAI
jgi:hypothetical protein